MSGSMSDGSSFMDALTDPRLDALLGATQGFAQAAMPTRMPTPFGAVLGMGGAGALQGAREGQQLALGGQQLQQAQIGNQRANMLLGAYKQMYGSGGAPFGAPASGGGGNTTGAMPGASGYLTSPQQLKMLGDLAMATGQDRSAATLYGMPNTMAGGAGYSMGANGTAFPTPGGAADPAQAARLKGAEAYGTKSAEAPFQPPISVDVPDGNGGTITKQIPVAEWAATHGGAPPPASSPQAASIPALQSIPDNPTRMLAVNAALKAGLPPAAWAPWIASVHTESGWNPSAPDGAAGEIGIGQVKPATGQMVGFTPQQLRDPGTNLVASAKYFAKQWQAGGGDPSKAITGYNAGDVNGTAGPDYVSQGMGRLASWGYPGVAPAPGYGGKVTLGPQQQAALDVQTAKEKAINDANASRGRLITTRAGVVDPTQTDPATGMAKEIYRQPEYHELQDPASGQEYPAFVSPAADGKLSVQGGPPGMAPGQIPPSKLGPGMEDSIKHLADQYANEDKQKYEGATNSLFQLDQQDKNVAALNQGGGWSSTGAGANSRLEWAKGINSGFAALGITPPIDPAKVSSWEDATKIQTQLAFAQAKQLGSREAQQVISMSRAATPGAENTPQGYQAISSGYHEMNNREVDSYNFKTGWLQSHGGNLTGAETAFNNNFTPKMYADRAVSTVAPVKITATDQPTAMAQMSHYLPGTVVSLANGKTTIVPQRPNSPPIPSYIQGYIQPGAPANAP